MRNLSAKPLRNIAAFVFLTTLSFSSFAYDYPRAVDNLTEDYADCAAYYGFVWALSVRNDWKDSQSDYKKAREDSLIWVRQLMKERPPGWADAKIALHQKLVEEKLKNEGMDGLYLAYADSCKLAIQNYKARLQYWLDK